VINMTGKKAIIIGAGIAGLSASCYLQMNGFDTEIFEKNPKSKIYTHLGVGNHFDHVEIFLASLMYMVDNALFDSFIFYLDSYGMVSTRIRKKHYLGKQIISLGSKKPDSSTFKWFIITSVINSTISGNEIEKLIPSKYLDLDWEFVANSIKGYEKTKFSALMCYESQMKLFGEKHLAKFFNRHHENWNSSELFLKVKEI